MTNSPQSHPKIIVVGAGFGGVRAARKLSRDATLDVTLISSEDNFVYYPQLYHTATGGARTVSALPISKLLPASVKFVQDTMTDLDPEKKVVKGKNGSYEYDEVVLALGNVTNYFGIAGLEELSYNIKSIAGAEKFKQHLHQQLDETKKPDAHYVVVGGGPTGIELAAGLAHYLPQLMKMHGIKDPKYTIDLVEALPRLLPRSAESYAAKIHKRLQKLGINVMVGAAVQGQTKDALTVNGQSIETKTVVWTAGVANNPFYKAHAELFTLAKNGKVEVNEYLEGRANVHIVGDNAATQFSGMAQTALHDADYVAADIIRTHQGQARQPYHAARPIGVIPVGEYWAAAEWKGLAVYGLIGYLLRRAADLIGYADVSNYVYSAGICLQDGRHEDLCKVCQPA
ncbi:MAG TPA: FAD-dependent oxidoreductase [Candidatus Saccharimonadia bacterium]|jgi:NADH dehydrogenase|nr:FAD-dependent oxidoreductase [Candidatus Saccharimonadia bacterium]